MKPCSAKIGKRIINIDEKGHVDVITETTSQGSTKEQLRAIAKEIGLSFDEVKETTQSLGKKIVKILNGDNSEASEGQHTYYLRLESERFWRFDTINLENANDNDILEGFEDQTGWTGIVGETKCLYTHKEDIDAACGKDGDGDESLQEWLGGAEAAKQILDMIGDNCVNDNGYFADAEEDFRIVVLDNEENEIETIESSEIPSFRCEQGYQANLNDYDEDDEEYKLMEKYFEMTCTSGKREHAFTPADEDCWFWLNVQNCCAEDFPVYQLITKGEFDSGKLSVKNVLIEEAVSGMMSIECVTEVLYDGEPLDMYEGAIADEEECTNFLIKMDSDGHFPEKVYDMTNYEES